MMIMNMGHDVFTTDFTSSTTTNNNTDSRILNIDADDENGDDDAMICVLQSLPLSHYICTITAL